MIRADVNMTGTIKRSATTRTDKNEKPYLSFVVNVKLQDAKGKGRDLDVLVTFQGGKKSDLSLFMEKQRVTVQGTLDIRKKGEDLAFYLTASKVSVKNVPDEDGITGELHFRGSSPKLLSALQTLWTGSPITVKKEPLMPLMPM